MPRSSHPPDVASSIPADVRVDVVCNVDSEQIRKARHSLSMPVVQPFQNGRLQHADSHLLNSARRGDIQERWGDSRRQCMHTTDSGVAMRSLPILAILFAGGASFPLLAQQGPTDPQIAHIVVTANQVDIDAGKLAQRKGSSQEVRQFGNQMVADHTAVNKQATELVKKLKVTPQANETSASLKKGGDKNIAELEKLSGKQFDKQYVANEVTYHQAVIDAVDKTLLPSARNEELKVLIEKVRPALVQHLEHAKHLQAQLAK
jgi:putative membrane protein